MSYIHLTIHQRITIETLHAEGLSTRQIASHIGVHHPAVARELKRTASSHAYTANEAQRDYEQKGSHKGRRSLRSYPHAESYQCRHAAGHSTLVAHIAPRGSTGCRI